VRAEREIAASIKAVDLQNAYKHLSLRGFTR